MNKTRVQPETLSFARVATQAKDNADGFLYVHNWATGFQQLVFASKEAAETWISNTNEQREEA